ncbi:hypothetical protein B0H16DRAFT_337296 [Mycena metata]|uniref:Uncharacterized protein n=1 Tax=Mycena metata TaxID=1033252 RepID=A0AAD7NN82_9AGAR|nr:hypothetical protein B0H16DRAFT_337296 [Mycena metata]
MSVAAVVQPNRAEAKESGRVKKFLNKVAVKSFLRRKTVPPPDPKIETLSMHEFISRGWDIRLNEWRKQMYPSLTSTFHRLRPEEDAVAAWRIAVDDVAPKTKGKQREGGPDPPEIQVSAPRNDEVGGISSDASSTKGGQQMSGYADTATSVTSLGTHAAATEGLIIPAHPQVAETVAGPSGSK